MIHISQPTTSPSPLWLSSPQCNPFSTSFDSSQPLSSLSGAISSAWLPIPRAATPLTSLWAGERADTPFKRQNILGPARNTWLVQHAGPLPSHNAAPGRAATIFLPPSPSLMQEPPWDLVWTPRHAIFIHFLCVESLQSGTQLEKQIRVHSRKTPLLQTYYECFNEQPGLCH